MQSGYNTNIRYRGVLFHVQTEDGGQGRPRVMTHLFHGGTALATERTDYADQLEAEDLADQVRETMQSQHEGLLAKLQRGELDATIEASLGAGAFADATNPGIPAAPSAPTAHEDAPAEPLAARSVVALHAERPLQELVLDWLVARAEASPASR